MTMLSIVCDTKESTRGNSIMSKQWRQTYISVFSLPLLTLIITASATRTTGLGTQHSLHAQHFDPNSGISVRMTVTYEDPVRIEPAPVKSFRTTATTGPSYREAPSHLSHPRYTETNSSLQRASVEPNRLSISSTCNLPDRCTNVGDCAPGGIYTSCGSGKMCCPPKTTVSASRSLNTGAPSPSPKASVPTKSSVIRESVQEAFDNGLPAAFHGYLLLSEHPRMPPPAPNIGRSVPASGQAVAPTKSTGRTKPEQVRTLEFESGRNGGPPIRLGTPGTTPLSELKQKETELLPDVETCGPIYVESRITKGKDAHVGQFPWMVLLGFRSPPKTTVNFICAGSLINDRYVLTAAHCFTTQNILDEVRLGEFDLSKDPDGSRDNPAEPVKKEEAEEIIIHPNFSRSLLSHDIALIRLKNRIHNYSNTIKPICLPLDVTFRGTNYTVSGWGKTDYSHSNGSDIIQTTKVQLLSHADCLKRAAPYNLPLTTDQICAGGNQGHDVCSGDSGGPLTKIEAGNSPYAQPLNYVVGIVSFGADRPCGTAGLPSVYTNVTSYVTWIIENIRP